MGFGPGGGGGTVGSATDVALNNPSNNEVLTYDGTLGKWKNIAPQTGFADPTTTKGDLIVHGVSTTRLGVGTDGQLLTADAAQTEGIKWAAPGMATVTVSTGSEARPTATTVLWVGGSTQPTNMINGDLWFSPTAPTDTQAPTAPTNVQSSNITNTSFTLSWTASTDNIGVTAYEILLNGLSYAIITGTSTTVSGRSANTLYSCAVRARDAAGNWSNYSSAHDVTTDAVGNGEHSVYAQSVYPGLLKYTENPNITVASAFYTGPSGTTGWKVKGARVYVPAATSLPATCEVYLIKPGSGDPDFSVPVQTATLSVTAGQWNEVVFPSATVVDPAEVFWIGYKFSDGSYLSTTAVGTNSVQASDGSNLYLSEENLPAGRYRNYYRIDTGPTTSSTISAQGYGIDVTMSET